MTGLREVDSPCVTRVYAVTGHTDYPMHTTCVSEDSETTVCVAQYACIHTLCSLTPSPLMS